MRASTNHGNSPYLFDSASAFLRKLLDNVCVLLDVTVKQLIASDAFGDQPHFSSAANVVSPENTKPISRDYAEPIIDWLALRLNCLSTDIESYILTGNTAVQAIKEAAASVVFPHTAAGLGQLLTRLRTLIPLVNCVHVLTGHPSARFLPEGAMQKVCRARTQPLGGSLHSFNLERDFVTGLQKTIDDPYVPAWPDKVVHTISLTRLDEVMGKNGGFEFSETERNHVIENNLGAMDSGLVDQRLLDDRPGHRGEEFHSHMTTISVRAVFGSVATLRRIRPTLAWLLYVAHESPAQASMMEADRHIVEEASRVAIKDPVLVRHMLSKYLSQNSWIERDKIRRRSLF